MTLSKSFLERREQEVASWLREDMEAVDEPLELFALDEDSVAGYRPGVGGDPEMLQPFREANVAGKPRTPEQREARLALARRYIPSLSYTTAQLKRVFDERPEVFRALIRALVEADHAEDVGGGGMRDMPKMTPAEASRRMLRLFGQEYSTLPFYEAFRVLARGRSVRHLATKTGLSRARVFYLLGGEREPTGPDMEAVARAFGVHPSYFIEWRTAYVLVAILERMDGSPETSMNLYSKLAGMPSDARGERSAAR